MSTPRIDHHSMEVTLSMSLSRAAALALAVPRLAVLTAVEVVAMGACILAQAGADASRPLAPWRRSLIQAVVPSCTRVALLCVGFWRIGTPRGAVDVKAQLFVCGHRHLLDGFVLCWLLHAPSFLARRSMCDLPMYGASCERSTASLWTKKTPLHDSTLQLLSCTAMPHRCVGSASSCWLRRHKNTVLCQPRIEFGMARSRGRLFSS